MYERTTRAAAGFGDQVIFETVDTSQRENYLDWGISNAIFVDGKSISAGPPKSYEKVEKLIGKAVKKAAGNKGGMA